MLEGFHIPISLCLTGDVKLLRGDSEKQCQRGPSHHNPLSQPTRGTGCDTRHLSTSCIAASFQWQAANNPSSLVISELSVALYVPDVDKLPHANPLNSHWMKTVGGCSEHASVLMIYLFTGNPWSKSPPEQCGRQLREPLRRNRLFRSLLLFCNLHVFTTALLVSCILMIVPTTAE